MRTVEEISTTRANNSTEPVNYGRHAAGCKICTHALREEIERDFVSWRGPAEIVKTYHLRDRATVYRHAHALGLFPKRQRKVRAALERIIEKAGEVDVTAAAVVTAVQAYAKINAAGQWVSFSHERCQEIYQKLMAVRRDSFQHGETSGTYGRIIFPKGFTPSNEHSQSECKENGPEGRTFPECEEE